MQWIVRNEEFSLFILCKHWKKFHSVLLKTPYLQKCMSNVLKKVMPISLQFFVHARAILHTFIFNQIHNIKSWVLHVLFEVSKTSKWFYVLLLFLMICQLILYCFVVNLIEYVFATLHVLTYINCIYATSLLTRKIIDMVITLSKYKLRTEIMFC